MSRIKGKETGLEKMVFKELRRQGIYFAKHVKGIPGRPDIVKRKLRKVVFIDGDFWHGWKFNERKAKLSPFWRDKIAGNIKRDKKNFLRLKKEGWSYLRVWEHDLEKKPQETMEKIISFLRG